MTSWSKVDAATGATPMALLKAGDMEALTAAYPIKDMAIGFISGSAGEVSALMLLIGGVYLIVRKVISWQTPVAYIATVAVVTFLFPRGNDPMTFMLYNVLGGGLFLGAFFMATDYVTSPVTKKGQLIFGLGCGLITVFIRYFGSYPEGVCYSILIMNCCTWIIDKYTKPTRFGVDKESQEGGGKIMKIEGKFILKVAGTLTAISLVVAALLGATNALTEDKIAAINKANTEVARGGRQLARLRVPAHRGDPAGRYRRRQDAERQAHRGLPRRRERRGRWLCVQDRRRRLAGRHRNDRRRGRRPGHHGHLRGRRRRNERHRHEGHRQ